MKRGPQSAWVLMVRLPDNLVFQKNQVGTPHTFLHICGIVEDLRLGVAYSQYLMGNGFFPKKWPLHTPLCIYLKYNMLVSHLNIVVRYHPYSSNIGLR